MEKQESSSSSSSSSISIPRGIVIKESWCWSGASAAQLSWGIWLYKKGVSNESHFMPFKAFSVASLFVGSAATAAFASLRASGVHSVEDLKTVGANIRTGLGLRNKARDE